MNIFYDKNDFIEGKRIRTRLNTLHDYRLSLKKALVNPDQVILLPGYERQEETIYRFNSNDLPCKNLKQLKNRLKKDTDLGFLIQTKSFDELFRMRNYENNKNL